MDEKKEKKIYLGYGAYVKEGSWRGEVIVYCSNGIEDYNHISLEISAVRSLSRFADSLLLKEEDE